MVKENILFLHTVNTDVFSTVAMRIFKPILAQGSEEDERQQKSMRGREGKGENRTEGTECKKREGMTGGEKREDKETIR